MRLIIILLLLLIVPCLILAQAEMLPYLETPTANSMYVCWKAASGTGSTVQYGLTSSLGLSTTGSAYTFSTSIIWHWVKLINLTPSTRYYYKCTTGSQVSTINSFTTSPAIGTTTGHFRVIMMGDTRTNTADVTNLIAGMNTKMTQVYGADWKQMINLICHVGDSANSFSNPSTFVTEHLVPFSAISSSIPILITPGNHEAESANFYNFMKTEDMQGPEGKKYYSFDLADSRFLYLNSNTAGATQASWLQTRLNEAQTNPNVDFIFSVIHHHGHAEMQPSQNSSWVQNTVVPALGSISKPTMMSYGHSHDYERGTQPNARTRLLLCGAGGAPLEDWGDTDQADNPEIHVTLNWWSYVVIDINLATHSYTAKTYTTGNTQAHPGNIEYDSWTQSVTPVLYNASISSTTVNANGTVTLVSVPSQTYTGFGLMSSQFQVSTGTAFTTNAVDVSRNWIDVYETTGSPSYTPINVNAGINLQSYTVPNGVLQTGASYYWRVRYRSQNTDWGPWSAAQALVNSVAPAAPVVTISKVSNGFQLTWPAVAGITYYKVWASVTPAVNASWTLLQTVNRTYYTYLGAALDQFFRVTSSTTP